MSRILHCARCGAFVPRPRKKYCSLWCRILDSIYDWWNQDVPDTSKYWDW